METKNEVYEVINLGDSREQIPQVNEVQKKKKKKKGKLKKSKEETEKQIENDKEEEKISSKNQIKMFYVLAHGNHGHSNDWNSIKEELYRKHGATILLLTSTSNTHSTSEGIDIGGQNLACEISTFLWKSLKLGLPLVADQCYQLHLRTKANQISNVHNKSEKGGDKAEIVNEGEEFKIPKMDKLKNIYKERDLNMRYAKVQQLLINTATKCQLFMKENHLSRIPITLIGHSLGGLYVRNALGWLFQHNFFCKVDWNCDLDEQQVGKPLSFDLPSSNNNLYINQSSVDNNENKDSSTIIIDRKKELEKREEEERERGIFIGVNFISISTPHLGSRRPGGTASKYILKKIVHTYLNSINGLTGFELLLEDHLYQNSGKSSPIHPLIGKEEEPTALLVRMSEPSSPYMKSLNLFRYCTTIGITHYDRIVPYCSSLIVGSNPFHDQPPSITTFRMILSSGFEKEYSDLLLHYYSLSRKDEPANTDIIQEESVNDAEKKDSDRHNHLRFLHHQKTSSDPHKITETQHISPDYCSVIGVKTKNNYLSDLSKEVEYPECILTNLLTIPWRRVSIQFPHGPLVHELALKKERHRAVTMFFKNNYGEDFIDLLIEMLELDIEVWKYAKSSKS